MFHSCFIEISIFYSCTSKHEVASSKDELELEGGRFYYVGRLSKPSPTYSFTRMRFCSTKQLLQVTLIYS
jgi:hypothetical protein